MPLKAAGVIEIPDSAETLFDHGAFEPKSRRVFVAHTARNRVEVIDPDTSRHLATLDGFPEAAGVVADDGRVLVTNRGQQAWLASMPLLWKCASRAIPARGRTGLRSSRTHAWR